MLLDIPSINTYVSTYIDQFNVGYTNYADIRATKESEDELIQKLLSDAYQFEETVNDKESNWNIVL